MIERTGQCLCGKVAFRADVDADVQVCHCVQCQKWTGGGPFFSVRARNVKITGEERIKAYHASQWGERAFCRKCGSTLYWRMQGRPIASLAVGLLGDQSGLKVSEEIFVDHRPDWLPPFAGASQSTEAEEKAKLDAWMAEQDADA